MEEDGNENLNSISDIRKFFEEGAEPFKQGEFVEFWKSLSDEDKIAFQRANLQRA